MASTDSQVQVKFVTTSSSYVVTNTPITVPTKLRRYGLSEVVNHLLGKTEKLIPFDFLINGEFLRTSVQKYLEEKELSTENVLTIEYVESSQPPTLMSGYQHDDWVSTVKGSQHGLILTGGYDSNIRVWDQSHNCLVTLKGHSRPVKALAWLNQAQDVEAGAAHEIISGSDDTTLNLWKFQTKTKQFEKLVEFRSHTGSVTAVSSNSDGTRFVSSSWDGTLKIWNPKPLNDLHTDDTEEEQAAKKKRKRPAEDSKVITHSLVTMSDHTDSVTSVEWSKQQPTTIVSGGNDAFVRIWDSRTATNTLNLSCEKALQGLSLSPSTGLICTGHSDNTVRIWDPRVQGWVTSTVWSPSDTFLVATASHDQTIKVWDIRSSTPLHTVAAHEGKVLCLDWVKDLILSGGTDNKLKIFKINNPTKQ